MRHMLVIGPRKVITSCGIRIDAFYPMSGTALPARNKPEIKVALAHVDGVDCPTCLARVGATVAQEPEPVT